MFAGLACWELPFPWPELVYARLCTRATSISGKSGTLIPVIALRCLEALGWLSPVQACNWHSMFWELGTVVHQDWRASPGGRPVVSWLMVSLCAAVWKCMQFSAC